MKSISVSRLGLALLLLCATACVGVTNSMTADTLGKGNTQWAVSPTHVRFVGEGGSSGSMSGIQAHMLRGTSDTMDLGAKLSAQSLSLSEDTSDDFSLIGFGAEFLSRFQLKRGGMLNVALAPSAGYTRLAVLGEGAEGGANALQAKVPLLLGVPVGENQFVGSLSVQDAFFFGEGDSTNTINLGATAGFAWRVSKSIRIMPEIGMLYPLVGSVAGEGSSINDSGTFVLQFSVGLLFGGGSGPAQSDDEGASEEREEREQDNDGGEY